MNLTFYENSKEGRNTSFSPLLKQNLLPSVFSKFETDKKFTRDCLCLKMAKTNVFLPNYNNIKQEMEKVTKKVRKLFDIKNTIFKEMINKDHSSTYQNFIRGFGKYFFGPFGLVTLKYKSLKEDYRRRSVLDNKIFAGKLDYYDYSIKGNRFKQRIANSKKRILSISKNYAIVDENNDIYSMKAITTKKYFKPKDFVSLNRHKYKPLLTEIREIQQKKYKNITNKYRNKKSSMNKSNKNNMTYLKTDDNFYRYKNKNIYDNYKRAVYKIYNEYCNRKINKLSSEKNMDKSDNLGYISNLFLTQAGVLNNRFDDKKLKFNNTGYLRKNKMSLNKPINLRNVSFNI
jgi:hypothetical protein